jgi:phosphodiesterase/alkaline phosphatase D-like protein
LRSIRGGSRGRWSWVVRAITRKASYWQYSTDEETRTSAETTFRAKTTLVGLAAGTRYFFRFRARTPEGLRDWSRVISLIVV